MRDADAEIDPVGRLVNELHGFERLIRKTIAAGGRLTTAAAEAQGYKKLSPTAGSEIFAYINGSQCFVAEALDQIASAHRRLDALGRKLGYDVSAFGEIKPPSAALAPEGGNADTMA